MKYKLLKDLPFAKAGEVFERVTYISKNGLWDYDYLKISKREKIGEDKTSFTIDYNYFLGNFDEWFEEIQEPTDSAHWKPKIAEKYFYINEYGDVEWEVWNDDDVDNRLMAMGLVYRTEEECEEARDRRLAEVRLSQTSDFEPDFENGSGGWVVCYRRRAGKLDYIKTYGCDSGEPVRYATMKEAERSIRENREDWLIYFGVKE